MIIDNLELIKPLLTFEKAGDFYMLYIFKRKKDFPEQEQAEHQSVRTIKTYTVESIENLESKYEEIKQLCEVFHARAYIHVQSQNHAEVGLLMIEELAKRMYNGVFNQKHIFDSVVGKLKFREKRWVVDLDSKDVDYVNYCGKLINSIFPEENKVIEMIPTKNGYHLITKPFNVADFQKHFRLDKGDTPEIQKKNPTLLYLNQ